MACSRLLAASAPCCCADHHAPLRESKWRTSNEPVCSRAPPQSPRWPLSPVVPACRLFSQLMSRTHIVPRRRHASCWALCAFLGTLKALKRAHAAIGRSKDRSGHGDLLYVGTVLVVLSSRAISSRRVERQRRHRRR